jgi:long-chain fatty acid transport protein
MPSRSNAAPPRMYGPRSLAVAAILTVAALAAGTTPTHATDGYFMTGAGVQSKGMAGADTAWGNDPLSSMANPALGLQVGNVLGGNLEFFNPNRDATVGGVDFDSSNDLFLLPAFGYNRKLDAESALGVVFTANGGMNTTYEQTPGPFGMSKTGVDLMQAFLGVNYARAVGQGITVGAMPVLALQRFEARGLGAFAPMSQSPGDITDNGHDWSVGGGLKLGALWDISPQVTAGASYQSRMWMSKLSDYKGLFAEGGSFDIPAQVRLGVAVHATPALTVLADYERIYYGSVAAIANSGSNQAPLGSAGGPGFGWKDMDVYILGAEWQANPRLAVRAGYSWNSRFTDGSEAMFNILAPAVIQEHLALGATYQLNDDWEIAGAFSHAFRNTLDGSNPMLALDPPSGFGYPNGDISLHMDENELCVGAVRRW